MASIFSRHRANPAIRREHESGQSLLETALLLPLLITVVVGAAEIARLTYAAIEISNAAKAGVQYGAQNGYTASDAAGISSAAANDAANLTTLTTTSSFSCVCSDGTASTCSNGDCSSSHIEQTLTVNTQTTIDPLIHLPGLPKQYTLKGRAVQKCVQ